MEEVNAVDTICKLNAKIEHLQAEQEKHLLVIGETAIQRDKYKTDLAQGHACNACLKDQLEHGKRQCCVGQESCDVDGEILRLREALADKLGELDAECRVSQLAIKEVGNLQAEVKRLEVERDKYKWYLWPESDVETSPYKGKGQTWIQYAQAEFKRAEALQAEVTRLEGDVAELKQLLGSIGNSEDYVEQAEKAKAEVKRLEGEIDKLKKDDVFEICIPNLRSNEVQFVRDEMGKFTKELLNKLVALRKQRN